MALCVLLLFAGVPRAWGQTTALFIDSQPGDIVGGGEQRTFYGSAARFIVNRNPFDNIVYVDVEQIGFGWIRLAVGAPDRAPLAPGTYENAGYTSLPGRGYPFYRLPHIQATSIRGGCFHGQHNTGRFVVLELATTSEGQISQLAIDFEAHCGDRQPALFGAVRYNSKISSLLPFGGAYPTFGLRLEPAEHGTIAGGDFNCGAGNTQCEMAFATPMDVRLTATPEAAYRFAGWTGACSGDATMTVVVKFFETCGAVFEPLTETPRTAMVLLSDASGLVAPELRARYPGRSANWWFEVFGAGNDLRLTITTNDAEVTSLRLTAPAGQILAPATYVDAGPTMLDPAQPVLDIGTRRSGSCMVGSGRFVIHELEYAADGSVSRFAADIEEHCDGFWTQHTVNATVFASFRYNSLRAQPMPFESEGAVYHLQASAAPNGRLRSGDIDCRAASGVCEQTFPTVTSVTLHAEPDPGYVFLGWSGDCPNAGEVTQVTVDRRVSCHASFGPAVPAVPRTTVYIETTDGHYLGGPMRLTFSDGIQSSLLIGGRGLAVTATAVQYDRWSFEFWAPAGILQAGTEIQDVRVYRERYPLPGEGCAVPVFRRAVIHEFVDAPLAFAADVEFSCGNALLFAAVRINSLHPSIRPFGGDYPVFELRVPRPAHGTVSGLGIQCGSADALCVARYGTATAVVLTATPDPGYVFNGWTGYCSGNLPSAALYVNGVHHCQATFDALPSSGDRTFILAEETPADPAKPRLSYWWLTPGSVILVGSTAESVTFRRLPTGGDIVLGAASGQPLVIGTYTNAASPREQLRYRPRLAVGNAIGTCMRVDGRFTVYEVVRDAAGQIVRFAADFEQHCNGSTDAVFGVVRFNSTVAGERPFGDVPQPYSLRITPAVGGFVTGDSLACGESSPLCNAVYDTPREVTLVAEPAAGYQFAGWTGPCQGLERSGRVLVYGPTQCTPFFAAAPRWLLRLNSSGEPLLEGRSQVLSPATATFDSITATISRQGQPTSVTATVTSAEGLTVQLLFAAPIGGFLEPGIYGSVHSPPTFPNTHQFPMMRITAGTRGCSPWPDTSSFAVRDISIVDGQVAAFAVDFQHACGGVLSGSLRVDSAVPPRRVSRVDVWSALPGWQSPHRAVLFNASIAQGDGPAQFKWFIYDGTVWSVVRDWSPDSTLSWTPGVANANLRVGVWAREAGSSADAADAVASLAFPIEAGEVTLSSDRTAPQVVGTPITFTAFARGGQHNFEYKWFVFDGTSWSVLRDWSRFSTLAWEPQAPNEQYAIGVWIRGEGVTMDVAEHAASIPFAIRRQIVTVALSADKMPPQLPGSVVRFTAAAAGGAAPYQFKWWLYDGVSWALLQDWSPSNSFVWQPATENARYRIGVWVRSAGTVSDTAEGVQSFFYPIAVERIIGVGLTADRSSPQVTGGVITFTASPFPAAAAQYKWWLFDGLTWTMLRDWDANATFTWTAAMPGNYRIGVWARGAGVTTDAAQAVHSVGFDIADLVVAISSDRPAP